MFVVKSDIKQKDDRKQKKGGRKEAEPEQSDRSQPSELILFLSKERITPTFLITELTKDNKSPTL